MNARFRRGRTNVSRRKLIPESLAVFLSSDPGRPLPEYGHPPQSTNLPGDRPFYQAGRASIRVAVPATSWVPFADGFPPVEVRASPRARPAAPRLAPPTYPNPPSTRWFCHEQFHAILSSSFACLSETKVSGVIVLDVSLSSPLCPTTAWQAPFIRWGSSSNTSGSRLRRCP